RRLGTVPQAADGPAPSAVPTRGTEPGTVAAWWRAQSAAVQQRLIDDRTDAIANLDGIPADARDQAARLLLHREAAQLALGGTPASERELAGLATVEDRLDAPDARRAYLLGLDASDDRVIVAVGDPGRATDTLTFVPGIGSGLTNVGQTLDAIDNIQVAAEQLPPSDRRSSEADLSTIAWLDYATPATIEQAAKTAPATAGATRLSTFTAGLRTDSTQPGAHETVLGYSYGSVVTGVAAAQHGLDTDDVVLVGSPGTTVDTAAELGVSPDHVWATVARHDPIRLAGTWFGRSPVDPAFGARVFTSAPGSTDAPVATHMGYFETGTPSLENIARIAVGQTSEVF
ncbi:MAG TPA: alpha/beta hydrolase, partial [Micromonosporaceae bacterium]